MIDSKGILQRDPATGAPLDRGMCPCPCGSCPKVPAWARRSEREWEELRLVADDLTPANRKALGFFLSRRASVLPCDDPVYQWYAGVIVRAETEAACIRSDRAHDGIRAVMDTMIEVLTIRRR
jgi:hypothetical protein